MPRVARVTDIVIFPPPCLAANIADGSPMYYINSLRNGRITDPITCGGQLITGSSLFYDQGHRVSRITDLGVCPLCGTGVVVTGSPDHYEN